MTERRESKEEMGRRKEKEIREDRRKKGHGHEKEGKEGSRTGRKDEECLLWQVVPHVEDDAVCLTVQLLASMYQLCSARCRGEDKAGDGGGVCEAAESPWVTSIQDKLQSMTGEISTVVNQQLQVHSAPTHTQSISKR